jgi:hypothetical protein
VLLLTAVSVTLLLKSDRIQNWLTGKVTTYLTQQFRVQVSIRHISYDPFVAFSLDDVLLGDQKKDTLFFVKKLSFSVLGLNVDSMQVKLRNVEIDGAYSRIVYYSDKTFNMDVILDLIDTMPAPPGEPPFHLYFNSVKLTNSRFRFIDYGEKFEPEGFDPYNEDIRNIEMELSDFHILDDSLNFRMNHLSCTEKGGVVVNELQASTIVTPRGMYFNDLHLKTPYSEVTHTFNMHYNSWDELADFTDYVEMHAIVSNAKIDMRDIAHFIPGMKYYRQSFLVSGDFRGPLRNIKLRDLSVEFGKASRLEGTISLKGLPDVENLFMDVKAENAVTDKADIEYLIGRDMPSQLVTLGRMKFRGRYTGFYNDFVAYGHFNTAQGEINSDINMKLRKPPALSTYSGNLELIDFNLGRFAGVQEYIGRTTLTASLTGKGFALRDLESGFRSDITTLTANGYTYHNMKVDGSLARKIFNGKFQMRDANAKVDFDGTVNFREKVPTYKFHASLRQVNLDKLHLAHIKTVLSTDVDIDFAFKDVDRNEGSIVLRNILLEKDSTEYTLNKVTMQSVVGDQKRQFSMTSDIFSIDLRGNFLLLDMKASVQSILYNLLPNYFVAPRGQYMGEQEMQFKVAVNNPELITEVFYPVLRIGELQMSGRYSARNNEIVMNAVVDELHYREVGMEDVVLELNVSSVDKGKITAGIGEFTRNDSVLFDDFTLTSDFTQNRADVHLSVSDSTSANYASIHSDINFEPGAIHIVTGESFLRYNNIPVRIAEGSDIAVTDSVIRFTSVQLLQGAGKALVNGIYDLQSGMHNLRAEVSGINLGLVNVFVPSLTFRTGGSVNGSAVLKGSGDRRYVNSALTASSFSLDGDTIGDFVLNSNYNEKQQRFLLYMKSLSGQLQNFEIGGYVSTATQPNELNLTLAFNESNLHVFQAFLKDHVVLYGGTVSAKCRVTGTTEKPLIRGDALVRNADARIEYLKTRYRFTSAVTFDNTDIRVPQFIVTDEKNNTGKVSGHVVHDDFGSFVFDLRMTGLDRFQVLNTTARDNDIFYGQAYASGSVRLSGSPGDLTLETDLTTEKGTVIYIPLSDDVSSGTDGLINFVSRDTSLKAFVVKRSPLAGFTASCVIHATPDAEIQIVLDAQQGDIIKGRGTGNLRLELTRQGSFYMYGMYRIREGEYSFTAANVFSKKFTLREGGTITWAGDPLQAQMDIEGVYYVRRTGISEIVSNTGQNTSQATQVRIPVECLLFLKGKLMSPDIRFDINLPDLQSAIGSNKVHDIQNSLRTIRNDPDMLNMQVMSLMLFGKFAPLNGLTEGTTSTLSSGASTTLSDMFSSQASNLISKIIPGFDLVVDIQTATGTSKTRAIVTASKKFYDNRLELQTSYDPEFANANIATQYNLRKDGNLKLKAYNRNTTDLAGVRNNILTQGIGLYYRKEFDSFIELFKKKSAVNNNP